MTKQNEIDLLQKMIGEAREAGADYLYDALVALSLPFEMDIRSDFPGSFTVQTLTASADQVAQNRQESAELGRRCESLRLTIEHQENRLAELDKETRDYRDRVNKLLKF